MKIERSVFGRSGWCHANHCLLIVTLSRGQVATSWTMKKSAVADRQIINRVMRMRILSSHTRGSNRIRDLSTTSSPDSPAAYVTNRVRYQMLATTPHNPYPSKHVFSRLRKTVRMISNQPCFNPSTTSKSSLFINLYWNIGLEIQ